MSPGEVPGDPLGNGDAGGRNGLPHGGRDSMGHGVNDGPGEAQADSGLGRDRLFRDVPGGAGGADEAELRRLLQGAVADLVPSEDALDHLLRAVPARRARKRQAVVGIAAAVVLLGTAVPAFVHVANSGAAVDDHSVNAGHGEQAQGGTGSETGVEGGEQGGDTPAGSGATRQGEAQGGGTSQEPGTGETEGAGTDATPSADPLPVKAPVCGAGQLGVSSVQSGAPDASGKVYGTFRIANISEKDCVVGGAGRVSFEARGAADPARITVVAHAAGDAASGLPDPSQESPALVLQPQNAYEVRFAWIPTETCPTTSPPPTPTAPAESGGASGGATGSTGAGQSANGTEPQLGAADGTPANGSVAVSHTAEPGGPAAAATITNACAGTIYRTGVLDAS
ncbi:hypothetical protein [Streptomyces sp. NPDC048577]|uniref:hypothetical protein n=1 Tax=Streptomyces sp. NPDC048577 TaxID=3157209 RepID=UPI0034162639